MGTRWADVAKRVGSEQGCSRLMGFNDFIFIPLVYLFRIALILYTQIPKLSIPYDYFIKDGKFFLDSTMFAAILLQYVLLNTIVLVHVLIQYAIGIANTTLSVTWFWPSFYYHILTDPKGRTIRDMLRNPQNSPSSNRS